MKSSKEVNAHQIVIQTIYEEELEWSDDYKELTNQEQVENDGVIAKEAALACALLGEDPDSFAVKPYFLGVRGGHNEPLSRSTQVHIGKKINEMLSA